MFGEGTGDYLFTEVMNIDGDITDSSGFIDYDRVYAIMDSVEAEKGYYQGVCPDGWHLPNGFEWQNLMNFIEGKLDIEYDIGVYLFAAGFGVVVDSTAMKDVIVYAVRPDPARGDVTLGGSKDNALYIDGDGKWVISQNNDNHVMRVRCIKDE